MDREKKNPYVTQIELDEVEHRVIGRINEVDRKHDDNYSSMRVLVETTKRTMEHLNENSTRQTESIDRLSNEIREDSKLNRSRQEIIEENLRNQESKLDAHDRFITEQQKLKDGKRNSTVKWLSILVPIFVAFIAGLFGIVEIVIPFLMGGE